MHPYEHKGEHHRNQRLWVEKRLRAHNFRFHPDDHGLVCRKGPGNIQVFHRWGQSIWQDEGYLDLHPDSGFARVFEERTNLVRCHLQTDSKITRSGPTKDLKLESQTLYRARIRLRSKFDRQVCFLYFSAATERVAHQKHLLRVPRRWHLAL